MRPDQAQLLKRPRYVALDVLRGLTLALMIIVNTPGSEATAYGPLLHAAWNGMTLTDLVFPTFLFVVGTTLSITLRKFAGQPDATVVRTVVKRGLLIFLVGYLLYWFPFVTPQFEWMPIADTRIMGVLQRIGLSFIGAALIVHFWQIRGALLFSAAALLVYWFIMANFGDYTMTGNAGYFVDRAVFGVRHMYHGEGVAFDPEGILGLLPSIVNVLAGYVAGRYLQTHGHQRRTVLALVGAGLVCVAVALCWNTVFPINKKLWTSAFVLCTVGCDLIVLAALVWLIEIAGVRRFNYFFEVYGRNTLFIYVVADVLVVVLARLHVGQLNVYRWIYLRGFLSWLAPYHASLAFAICYMLVCWCIAYGLDRKKIYIKL